MTKGITKAKQKSKTKSIGFYEAMEHAKNIVGTVTIKNCRLTGDWDNIVIARMLHEDARELVFENCVFSMNMTTVEFPEAFRVSFENCTFQTMMYMNNSATQKYKKCKFNSRFNIKWAGDIIMEGCEWKDDCMDIDHCNSIMMEKCKGNDISVEYNHERFTLKESDFNIVEVDRCVFEDLNLYSTNVNELLVTYSNIESLGIYVHSYRKAKEIRRLKLYKSSISCGLDLDDAKVKLFEADQTSVTGNFQYVNGNIKKFDLECVNGIIPPQNSIYLYKKCWYKQKYDASGERIIVKLEVPETAKRVYCGNYKMRVSEAKVVEIYDLDGKVIKKPKNPTDYSVYSGWDSDFTYNIGAIVVPEFDFDEKTGSCGSGIHGFTDFNDAVKYDL